MDETPEPRDGPLRLFVLGCAVAVAALLVVGTVVAWFAKRAEVRKRESTMISLGWTASGTDGSGAMPLPSTRGARGDLAAVNLALRFTFR